MKDACKTLSVENLEKEKRRRILLSTIDESQKKEHDIKFLIENIDMDGAEIVYCFITDSVRKNKEGKPVPIPLVFVLKSEQATSFWMEGV